MKFCKNCKWLQDRSVQFGAFYYRCICPDIREKKRDWYDEYMLDNDPSLINANNDCCHFQNRVV